MNLAGFPQVILNLLDFVLKQVSVIRQHGLLLLLIRISVIAHNNPCYVDLLLIELVPGFFVAFLQNLVAGIAFRIPTCILVLNLQRYVCICVYGVSRWT